MGEEREKESPESLLTPDIIQILATDLLSETQALVEHAQRVREGREKLLAIIPSIASLDMDDYEVKPLVIFREGWRRARPDEERELVGFRVVFFQMSNGNVEEIYDIDFTIGRIFSQAFDVKVHLNKDSFDDADYTRRKKWKEVSPDDERYELAIGVALNKLMSELTLKETRDLDICLSRLEPTPEKSSE